MRAMEVRVSFLGIRSFLVHPLPTSADRGQPAGDLVFTTLLGTSAEEIVNLWFAVAAPRQRAGPGRTLECEFKFRPVEERNNASK